MDEALVMGLAERMEAAVALLEGAVARVAASEESVERIVATVESAREAELERKLAAAEARIAELTASASGLSSGTAGRKTLSAPMTAMLSKQGVVVDGLEAGAVDAALASLSVEQRIAVKSELLRAGVLR